jgi:hypothetical protein
MDTGRNTMADAVRQPRHQIGRTAAQLLLEESLGHDGHQHREVIFQPELEVRRSSQARTSPAPASTGPDPARNGLAGPPPRSAEPTR